MHVSFCVNLSFPRPFKDWPKDRRIAYECDTFKKMVEKDTCGSSFG